MFKQFIDAVNRFFKALFDLYQATLNTKKDNTKEKSPTVTVVEMPVIKTPRPLGQYLNAKNVTPVRSNTGMKNMATTPVGPEHVYFVRTATAIKEETKKSDTTKKPPVVLPVSENKPTEVTQNVKNATSAGFNFGPKPGLDKRFPPKFFNSSRPIEYVFDADKYRRFSRFNTGIKFGFKIG